MTNTHKDRFLTAIIFTVSVALFSSTIMTEEASLPIEANLNDNQHLVQTENQSTVNTTALGNTFYSQSGNR